MKTRNFTLALVAAMGMVSFTRADGIRVEFQKGASRTTLFNNPALFDTLTAAWNSNRGKIDQEIQKMLGSLNPKMPRGVSFVRQKSTVAAARITTRVDRGVGLAPVKMMEITLTISGNALTTRLTQPTILGSYADPEFRVNYDVRGRIYIPVNERARKLTVSAANFEIHNVRITPTNTPARVLSVFNSISRVVGGPDFKARGEQALSKTINLASRANAFLAPINSKLATLPANTRLELFPDRGFLIRATLVPVDNGPGPIVR